MVTPVPVPVPGTVELVVVYNYRIIVSYTIDIYNYVDLPAT